MNKTVSCIQCQQSEPMKVLKSIPEGVGRNELQFELKQNFVTELLPKVLCEGCYTSLLAQADFVEPRLIEDAAKVAKVLNFMVEDFLDSLNHTCRSLFTVYDWK